jgi:hypothetical protein
MTASTIKFYAKRHALDGSGEWVVAAPVFDALAGRLLEQETRTAEAERRLRYWLDNCCDGDPRCPHKVEDVAWLADRST